MVLTTVLLAAALTGAPATHAKHTPSQPTVKQIVTTTESSDANAQNAMEKPSYHVHSTDLHPMTDDEKRIFPGRENWDKTEWYEAQFKSAKVVIAPEHVDEWHNGGRDQG